MVLITYGHLHTTTFVQTFLVLQKNNHFLIPLAETLLLVVRRYCIEGFLLILVGEHIFASTTHKKEVFLIPLSYMCLKRLH